MQRGSTQTQNTSLLIPGHFAQALELPTKPQDSKDMAEDTPSDISNFARRHRLKAGRGERSADFTASRGKVIPWPTSPLNQMADRTITNVQIAIEDQIYAEQLRGLLEEDNKHRAYVVDQPNPTIDGVVVLDETTLGHVGVLKETDALRFIVLRKESSDPDKLWEAGVRYMVPAKYPPKLVRTMILGAEVRLNTEQSSNGSVPQTEE
jgi:hypothetical protein